MNISASLTSKILNFQPAHTRAHASSRPSEYVSALGLRATFAKCEVRTEVLGDLLVQVEHLHAEQRSLLSAGARARLPAVPFCFSMTLHRHSTHLEDCVPLVSVVRWHKVLQHALLGALPRRR